MSDKSDYPRLTRLGIVITRAAGDCWCVNVEQVFKAAGLWDRWLQFSENKTQPL